MISLVLSRLGWAVALLVLQVFFFNHVHLYGYATPMPYLYILLILPVNTPRWVYLVTGFAMGAVLDSFSSTPGVAATTFCATGLCVPALLRVLKPSDDESEQFLPSRLTMGSFPFFTFALLTSLFHCFLFHAIETFSFFQWTELIINAAGSAGLTLLIVLLLEVMRTRRA